MGGEQEQVENEGVQSFLSRALRRKMPGSYEQLLCQHLIRSVAAEPLEKIRLVSEAAYMVPDTPVDKNILESIYRVVTSLTSTEVSIQNQQHWSGNIPWNFELSDENFKRFIEPWFETGTLYTAFFYGRPGYDETQKLKERLDAAETPAEYFRLTNKVKGYHLAGFEQLKSEFVKWAMPETMKMFEALSKLVSPDLYETILEKMKV